jgi:hypothetical protein
MRRLREEQWSSCAEALDESLAHAQAIPYPYAVVKALWIYGRLERAWGEPLAAQRQFEQALTICARLGERLYAERIERDPMSLPDQASSPATQ